MLALGQQELGRLWEDDEGETSQQTGHTADESEESPAGPGHGVGDDDPGQSRHHHVTHHPECSQHTQHSSSLILGLKLCEVGPDKRNTATNSGINIYHFTFVRCKIVKNLNVRKGILPTTLHITL